MSLFLRFFLFSWFTAALLVASFTLLGLFSGSEAMEKQQEILRAQAMTVSTLWQQRGARAAQHWNMRLPGGEKPVITDRWGKSPLRMHAIELSADAPGLPLPLEAGVYHAGLNRVILVAGVPGVEPPLFLVQRLGAGQIHRLPVWLRLIVAMIIISLLSYLLAYFLSRRIRRLRDAVQRVSRGDLSSRVDLPGTDEVSALAADFNQMADRVDEMLTSQRQLVSDVSHELRSPLARLRIALELGQKTDNSTALSRIGKEADELESLVTELLSLARIESGQFHLEKRQTRLDRLLQQIVHDANFEAESRHCRVQLDMPEAVELSLDPVLIRAAIENVARNAIRYSPENGIVRIAVEAQADRISIIVEDDGPGVPEEALEKLFKPFARIAEARDRDSGGFGLGLAITGKSLLAHGGKAYAENRARGGLKVTMVLPTASGAAQDRE